MSLSRSRHARAAVAAAAACCAGGASALDLPVSYELTRPAWAPAALRLSAADGGSPGLSLDAGQAWFGRIGLGQGHDADAQWRVGGGYRWRNGESLSLELTRSLGRSQPGLAVHYDWPRYYLRLSYDPQPGELPQQLLRFSAGMRF